MKFAVVDVGNTSTAAGLWSGGRVAKVSHHAGRREGAEKAVAELIAHGACGISYLSVVPSADRKWRAFAKRAGVPFHQISYRDFGCSAVARRIGLKFDYAKPETIGADRLADAAAAMDRYGAPVIVCDFGTAFTAAAITSGGVWCGGAIAPGLPLMGDYLFERTAKLPRVSFDGARPHPGRDTESAMVFGSVVGCRGMVREITGELRKAFGEDCRLVATGGYAKTVLKGSGMEFTVDPTLTLHGAGLLASLIAEEKGIRA